MPVIGKPTPTKPRKGDGGGKQVRNKVFEKDKETKMVQLLVEEKEKNKDDLINYQ